MPSKENTQFRSGLDLGPCQFIRTAVGVRLAQLNIIRSTDLGLCQFKRITVGGTGSGIWTFNKLSTSMVRKLIQVPSLANVLVIDTCTVGGFRAF